MVEHWFRSDKSFSIPGADYWYILKECLDITDDKFDQAICDFEYKDNNFDMAKRLYHIDGKYPTLTTQINNRENITDGDKLFSLTPENCEILQTLPTGYTKGVSPRQRYKMIGNGWTVDVIAYILINLK